MHAHGHADTPPTYQHRPLPRRSRRQTTEGPIFSAVNIGIPTFGHRGRRIRRLIKRPRGGPVRSSPSPPRRMPGAETPPSRTAVCASPARPKVFAWIKVYLRMNARGPSRARPDLPGVKAGAGTVSPFCWCSATPRRADPRRACHPPRAFGSNLDRNILEVATAINRWQKTFYFWGTWAHEPEVLPGRRFHRSTYLLLAAALCRVLRRHPCLAA
jgi:hypothetical protein